MKSEQGLVVGGFVVNFWLLGFLGFFNFYFV